jgi:hypothetical protein
MPVNDICIRIIEEYIKKMGKTWGTAERMA